MIEAKSVLGQVIWRTVVTFAVLVLAVMAPHAQAQAVFSLPVNVSNNSGNSQFPRIAVDSSGNINLIWLDNSPGNFSVFFSRS
ncbi:MAG: hypothetical protein DMG38_14515 [Acidobacteria bacterium]|nr:MAG: hypothetical protein DMG38_14515 [Acidobacteriota bacterium]